MNRRFLYWQTRGKKALYSIFIRKSAERDLDSINEPFLSRIITGIEILAKNPRNTQVKKLVKRDNEYSLRVGDYRILFVIDELQKNYSK
jgi:mRNA interferase RelE/StbE